MSVDTFIPEVWSQELRAAYEKNLVFGSLCNRDYEGDIAQSGDTVHINSIGEPTVDDYDGDEDITVEDLSTTDQTLLINQCKYFAFKVDDCDKRQAAGNMLTKGMQRAAYKMKDAADQYVAGLYTGADSGNVINTVHINSGDTAYEQLINLGVLLDQANVPDEGRNAVAPPWFFGLLVTSKYATNAAFQAANAAIQSGKIGEIAGFMLHKSNNVKVITGDDYAVTAMTEDAITFADQINETEAMRMEKRFADLVRGLHLYGAKVVEPKALAVLKASKTAVS
jgi:hypothetical protein